MSKHIFCIFLFILGMHLMYKFVILDIQTNKIIFMVFLKWRSSSRRFHKVVSKSKNTCEDINKTIFLEFLYLNMLNFCIIIYTNMIFYYFFERLGHMHMNKKYIFCILFQNRNLLFFVFFLRFKKKTSIFNIRSVLQNKFTILIEKNLKNK